MSDPTVYLRLPDGQQRKEDFELLPRIGETIHFDDGTFRVSGVEWRVFPDAGTFFYPVLLLDEIR